MGKIEEYLNSLEGQENLDVHEVASKMLELHNEEIGIRDAKIETLNSSVAERDTKLADVENNLTLQKAKNFDLAMQIPGYQAEDQQSKDEQTTERTISDLFVPAE